MDKIDAILHGVAESLKRVPSIEAVVLGGSRARGTHSDDSDVDVGVYYDRDALDLSALEAVARGLDDEHRRNLIAAPGEWGRWVNGGGWLVIEGRPVDLLLRDAERVRATIAECQHGVLTPHYQVGHPHAYINAMYMGELATCRMLWDRTGKMSRLKSATEVYPPKLKTAAVQTFGFEAGFSCMLARTCAHKDDLYYVVANIVRAVSCINQVLFALNEQYCLNEKKAVGMIASFAIKPDGYKERIDALFQQAGTQPALACEVLGALIDEVKRLTPDLR